MMSLGQQISRAIDSLIENPPNNGVFSEIDVLAKVARKSWDEDDLRKAVRQINEVCGRRYRARKLCRFGPVELPDGTQDYGRIAAKIAYADAESGPKVWETANGTFLRLMIEGDKLVSQGRRHGTNRNDLAPWDDQDLDHQPRRVLTDPALERMRDRVQELEDENERLRNGDGEKPQWAIELENRLAILEGVEAERRQIYADR